MGLKRIFGKSRGRSTSYKQVARCPRRGDAAAHSPGLAGHLEQRAAMQQSVEKSLACRKFRNANQAMVIEGSAIAL